MEAFDFSFLTFPSIHSLCSKWPLEERVVYMSGEILLPRRGVMATLPREFTDSQ